MKLEKRQIYHDRKWITGSLGLGADGKLTEEGNIVGGRKGSIDGF